MFDWLKDLSAGQLVLLAIVTFVVLAVASSLLTWVLVRRGMRTPFFVRRMNRLTQWVIDRIKRPITVAVLGEVGDVLRSGHYTKNISAALVENHDELVALVAEKVRADPATRVVGRIPGYDTVVHQVSETTLRVLVEMLGDPRMDELVSDLLRYNLEQIRQAVIEHQREDEGPLRAAPEPPGDASPMVGPRPGL